MVSYLRSQPVSPIMSLGLKLTSIFREIRIHIFIAMIFMLFLFRVLKDFYDWKESPLHCLVLSLYHLQGFYLNENKRGLAGLGKYTIAPKYKSACLDQYAVHYHPRSYPKNNVRGIREGERGIKTLIVDVKTNDKDQQPQDKTHDNCLCKWIEHNC